MPEDIQEKSKVPFYKRIFDSNIPRVVIFLLILGVYTVFVSPFLESFFNRTASTIFRNSNISRVNSLTPVFDIYVYAGDYNLNTDIYSDSVFSKTKFFTIDARIVAMNKFLTDYHSPMAPYAKTIVNKADEYGLDWRLVASISGVESAFGNIVPDGDSNNAWGWRGGEGGDWSRFDTWDDGITEITRGLAQGYGVDLTPFEIEPTYCPPCAEGSAHAWANGVTGYMTELRYYLDNLENL